MNAALARVCRALMMLVAVAGLAACQTVPPPPASPFTAAQRTVLERRGFEEQGGNFLLGLNNRLLFGFDSSEINPAQQEMLRELARELVAVGIGSSKVEGHASQEGDAGHNMKLSERRAQAVSKMLVEGGFAAPRMRVLGLGELDPVASNDSREGRSENRRVVIVVTPADVMAL
ncbi:MAG: OmpA family protein [Porphyrobacter sp.]|nr:OmpA family protein [Porphyrobacter sp.]